MERYLIVGSLLAGAYLTYTCPCKDPLLSCHLGEFVALTASPLVFALYLNREVLADALPK